MINDEDRVRLHAELDRIVDRANAFTEVVEDIDSSTLSGRDVEAQLIVRLALDLALAAAGREAHLQAIGEADVGAGKVRISRCLRLVERLVDPAGSMAPSVRDFALEIRAIAAGDAPRLLAVQKRVKGRPTNAYRRLVYQLRALEWDALMAEFSLKAEQRQAMISSGFGRPWDTISRWKEPCVVGLGVEVVDLAIYFARVSANDWVGARLEELQLRIDRDGAAFRAELVAGTRPNWPPSE